MRGTLFKVTPVLFLLFILLSVNASAQNKKLSKQLHQVDQTIAHAHDYMQQVETEIQSLRQQITKACNDEELYAFNNQIIDRYTFFINDSTLHYIDQNLTIAEHNHRKDMISECHLKKAEVYIQIGMLDKAIEETEMVVLDDLPVDQKFHYYSNKLFLSVRQNRLSENDLAVDQQLVNDLIANVQPGNDFDEVWAVFWRSQLMDSPDIVINELPEYIDKLLANNAPMAGRIIFLLAGAYRLSGSQDMYLKTLCQSVQQSVKTMDCDVTAILELISYLIEQDDNQRAYRYMEYVVEGQTLNPDYIRSAQINQIMRQVFNSTQQISKKQLERINNYMHWLMAAVVGLVILAIIICLSMRNVLKQRKDIQRTNEQLSQNIKQLHQTQQSLMDSNTQLLQATWQVQQVNKDLQQANYIKEVYIGSLFSTCSNFINKLDAFRSDINRKIKAGKMSEASQLVSPENSFMKDEIVELNQNFDETFLSIYPSFVDDFNTLLRPEERIEQKGMNLNTDLRIYALIWLGIESSSKIASLLHVSNQTVYNARTRMRTHAIDETVNATEFVMRVQGLGRKKDSTPTTLNDF